MKKILFSAIIILLVVFGAMALFGDQETNNQLNNGANDQLSNEVIEQVNNETKEQESDEPEQNLDTLPDLDSSNNEQNHSSAEIVYTQNGFLPQTITISPGTSIVFKNAGSVGFWVASNNHPTHTLYPGSTIEKCGTNQESAVFDSCGSIEPGGTYTFKFNETGSWGYHNHFNASEGGLIIVE